MLFSATIYQLRQELLTLACPNTLRSTSHFFFFTQPFDAVSQLSLGAIATESNLHSLCNSTQLTQLNATQHNSHNVCNSHNSNNSYNSHSSHNSHISHNSHTHTAHTTHATHTTRKTHTTLCNSTQLTQLLQLNAAHPTDGNSLASTSLTQINATLKAVLMQLNIHVISFMSPWSVPASSDILV